MTKLKRRQKEFSMEKENSNIKCGIEEVKVGRYSRYTRSLLLLYTFYS